MGRGWDAVETRNGRGWDAVGTGMGRRGGRDGVRTGGGSTQGHGDGDDAGTPVTEGAKPP